MLVYSLDTNVKIYRVTLKSSGYIAQDITGYVFKIVSESNVSKGIAIIYTNEEGCSVIEIEYEPELLADLEQLLKELRCMDKNLCDTILGRNIIIPIINGSLFLGRFKNIVFIDMSNKIGDKSLVIVIEGLFKNS